MIFAMPLGFQAGAPLAPNSSVGRTSHLFSAVGSRWRCCFAMLRVACACAGLTFFAIPDIGRADEKAGIDLFDGKSLDGWYVLVNGRGEQDDQDIFTVRDGAIQAYANLPANSEQPFAALVTDDQFGDFHLELEYQWGAKKFAPRHDYVRDAGIIFRMHDPHQFWPSGIELQIQEGDTGDIWIIGTQASSKVHGVEGNYSPGGELQTRGTKDQRFARFPRSHYWETPGWNRVEIVAQGDHAVYKVNGHIVNEVFGMKRWDPATEQFVPLERGNILLQAEGSEVSYRNIRLTPLD